MRRDWWHIERVAGLAFFALVAIGCTVVLRPFLTDILWAAILCYTTWPLYRAVERRLRGRKNLAAGLMTVAIALVLVLPFAIVGFTFADNVARVAQHVQNYRSEVLPPAPEWLVRLPLAGDWLGNYWQSLRDNAELAAATLKQWFDELTPRLLRWSIGLGRGIFDLALSVLIAFFLYRDGVRVVARLDQGIKRIAGEPAQHLLETTGATIKSVVYGLLGTALAQGIMAGIGFTIAGIPGALLWALLTFLFSLVPVGPPLVWVPATVWLLLNGRVGWGIFMGIWGLVAISGIDNVVRPVLISRGGTLPFALTLLGVLGGLLAFGFVGVFLGPTLLAVGYALLREFLRNRPANPSARHRRPGVAATAPEQTVQPPTC